MSVDIRVQAAILVLIVFILFVLHDWRGGTPSLTGPVRVIDGDTLASHTSVRVRLLGIDAPELAQSCNHHDGRRYACGEMAANTLRTLIGGQIVTCQGHDLDRYGRMVGQCFRGESEAGVDLGREMVRRGMAVAYRRYSTLYVEEEAQARQAERGLWAGSFQIPERWRQQHQ